MYDGTKVTYFTYPEDKLFRGELQKLFKQKEDYESQFGPVASACLCIECSSNGEKIAWLSPTCEICDGLEDVDHVDILLTNNEISALLFKATSEMFKQDVIETFNQLTKNFDKLKKYFEEFRYSMEVESYE